MLCNQYVLKECSPLIIVIIICLLLKFGIIEKHKEKICFFNVYYEHGKLMEIWTVIYINSGVLGKKCFSLSSNLIVDIISLGGENNLCICQTLFKNPSS